MPVSKEAFRAALEHGAPTDGPFDISDEDRNEVLIELGLKEAPKKAAKTKK